LKEWLRKTHMQKTLELEQNNINFKSISLEAINDIASFYCSNHSMDEFLKREAYLTHIFREASTTLVYYGEELVAYYTLKRNKLKIDIESQAIQEPHYFALDLARLAVSKNYQGKGLGTYIINNIVTMAHRVNDRFITTDALYERWQWYKEFSFDYLKEEEINPKTMNGLVYMLMDLYDPKLLEDYFDE
jgi:GNAT superfamily N-acetyltransferase